MLITSHPSVSRFLLEKGRVDVNNRDNGGRTGLHWVAQFGNEAMVKMLVDEFKADANIKDNRGKTALDWAIRENEQSSEWSLEFVH